MKLQFYPGMVAGDECPLFVIAGPCVIESESVVMEIAGQMVEITRKLGLPYIFKASFDKANRSSIQSYRGPGIESGLKLLQKVKQTYQIPVLTDIHEPFQAKLAAEVADILQIPAFLCRQTDLLLAAGKTGKSVNVKKGQFVAPMDMKNVIHKIESTGNKNILLTERGASFGYNNLVVDMRAIPMMRSLGYPVIFDATHAVQRPSASGTTSGGDREFVEFLARGAVAVGCDGIFFETHPNPDKALSDGPNMVPLKDMEALLQQLKDIHQAIQKKTTMNSHSSAPRTPKDSCALTTKESVLKEVIIYSDGCSKGNPGRAGIGVVIQDARGNVIQEIAQPIGTATNNVAEYTALIVGLESAIKMNASKVKIFADSELMVRQINGQYSVKDIHLKQLFLKVMGLLNQFKHFEIQHIPREMNQEADRLSNEALE